MAFTPEVTGGVRGTCLRVGLRRGSTIRIGRRRKWLKRVISTVRPTTLTFSTAEQD